MQKAKELLVSGNYKVYEVAEMVGLKDIKHFRETFKLYFGVTPNSI